MIMWKYIKAHHFELGIIIANIGTQISVITKEFISFGNFNLTYVMFFLSLLLLTNYTIVLKCKFPRPSGMMGMVLFYNIYVIINGLLMNASIFNGNDALIFSFYIIAMWLCVNTNIRKIDGYFLVTAMWWITGIYSCLLFYILTNHFRNLEGISFTVLSSGTDRLTLSVMGFMHLCTFLLYAPHSLIKKGLKFLFAIIAFYDLSICSRRGLLIALALIVLYQIYVKCNENITQKKFLSALIGIVSIMLVISIIVIVKPEILASIERYGHRLISGIKTYLGIFSGSADAAAEARKIVMNSVPQEYLASDIITILFGNGYGYQQLDIPYLQAFTDIGIIGGLYYLIIEGICPVKLLLKREQDYGINLLKYIGIMTITYNLYSGVPYGHYKFVGLIMLFYTANMKAGSKVQN